MNIVVVTPPAAPVISLSEAKAHLRVDTPDDDGYIAGLVAAATANLDGPAGWLGRCLVNQTLEARFDGFDAEMPLPYAPVSSISSVKYDDANGAEQTLSTDVYRAVGQPDLTRVVLKYNQSWPVTRSQEEAVRIRYVAGYGATGADVPASIRQAMLLMVGAWYENREDVAVGVSVSALPRSIAADALLAPYRVYR